MDGTHLALRDLPTAILAAIAINISDGRIVGRLAKAQLKMSRHHPSRRVAALEDQLQVVGRMNSLAHSCSRRLQKFRNVLATRTRRESGSVKSRVRGEAIAKRLIIVIVCGPEIRRDEIVQVCTILKSPDPLL